MPPVQPPQGEVPQANPLQGEAAQANETQAGVAQAKAPRGEAAKAKAASLEGHPAHAPQAKAASAGAHPAKAAGVFEALGEPVRRRILELLADGERPVGPLVAALRSLAPISQPAVSQHLRVLLAAGLVTVRAAGTRRLYALDADGLNAARAWLDRLADPLAPFAQPLDALATEVARGRRADRTSAASTNAERANAERASGARANADKANADKANADSARADGATMVGGPDRAGQDRRPA